MNLVCLHPPRLVPEWVCGMRLVPMIRLQSLKTLAVRHRLALHPPTNRLCLRLLMDLMETKMCLLVLNEDADLKTLELKQTQDLIGPSGTLEKQSRDCDRRRELLFATLFDNCMSGCGMHRPSA